MRPRLRRPPRRQTLRWFARSAALAWLGFALPAGAATDKIVVSEFLLRCADGRPDGAFVELVAAGPGQTFDAALGVRLLGPSGGTIADLPGVFASRAGQPWPEGQHFLIATAAFEPLTGVAPDTVFSSPPTSNGGAVVLYRKVGTSIQLLQRMDYSSSSTPRIPPPGRSTVRVAPGVYQWSSDPSPTRSDGVPARAPGCFADPHRPIRVTELATQCGGGNPAGGFLEVSPTSDNQALDADLALRALDHAGAILFDVPLGFGSLTGNPWPTNRTWLVGDSLLQGSLGNGPDLVWPAPLDTVGGSVVLHGLDATGAEVVLSQLDYGTPGLPAPPAGVSLVWDVFSGRYVQKSPSTPTDFAGGSHVSRACIPPSSVRIQELLTFCASDGHDSYVDLLATADGELRDTTLTLEVHDATGAVTAVVPAGFGASGGAPWAANTHWLFATAGISNDVSATPDVLLPAPLDSIAGRVDVVRRVSGVPEVIQSLRWGGTQPTPAAGQALRRVTDTNYQIVNTPQPRTSVGQLLRCAPPADTTIAAVVRSIEVCLGCWDGSRYGQYIRLFLNPGTFLDTSFVLRLYGGSTGIGPLLGTTRRLFASANPRRPSDARSWLVTDPDYPITAAIDAVLPAALTSSGMIEVVWVRNGVERAGAQFRYGGALNYQPPPGYASSYDGYPSPVSFKGVPGAIPGCHFTAALGPGDPHISEVFPACASRDSSRQFIELYPVASDHTPDPRLSLRVHDASGRVLQTLSHILPATIPPGLGGTGPRTLLVGSPAFQGATGLVPDRVLTEPIALSPGSLELFYDDPQMGEQAGLQVVNLTPGTTPLFGRSLVIPASGVPTSSRSPVASRLNGDSLAIPDDCRDTLVTVPMVLQKLALGCFDGDPRGQFIQLAAASSGDSLTGAFALRAFDHNGALVGEVAPAFGGHTGLPGPVRSLLIARLDAQLPVQLDAPLGFVLDTLGGTLELVEHRARGDLVAWSRSYPASDPHGFIMGSIRQLVAGTTWSAGSPLLTDWSNQTGNLLGCHLGSGTLPAVQVKSLLGACGDGSPGPSYVELVAGALTPQLAGLELQVSDANTSMTVPLFPSAHAFDVWPAGRSLLLATDAFAGAMGFPPDRRLPRSFGAGAGGITVRYVDPTETNPHTLVNESLDFSSFPEPGRALVRATNALVPTSSPTPATFDGIVHTLPPDCFVQTGVPDAVRLSAVMLDCADGSTASQFVQVERTSALAVRDPGLRLRLLDRDGHALGEGDHLFPSGATFWGHVNSLVIGGAGFASAFGFAADATLPAALDTLGGTIQLVRTEAGADRVLSELRYGPGGIAAPAPASALVLDQGTWKPDTLPHPRGFSGDGALSPSCRLHCDLQHVQLSLGASQPVSPPIADYTDTYSQVTYDLSRAEFDVRSTFAHAELQLKDRYFLAGPTTSALVQATLDVIEAHADSCSRNACFRAVRRLHLIVNGVEADSLPASATGSAQLHASVPFLPGEATLIQVLASADGLQAPPLTGRVTGRLRFQTPADGTRVISCGGYDSDRARIVHEAQWSLSPHTVTIDWRITAAAGFAADVERLDEADPQGVWSLRERLPVGASGLLHFVDPKAPAEHTYRYRLAWSDAFGSYTSDETRVHIPRLPSFGLVGAQPNPSRGALRVAFELPDPADVHVELFDLLGRRVREVRAAFGAGVQSVALDEGSRLAPGLYQVRMEAGGRHAHTTVVVLP